MNNIVLTIGIPTFNGSKYIREAIESVISQVDDRFAKSVEILVSDNASTDDTGRIINECIGRAEITVAYVCNEVNVGYDRNVDNLFKHAKGKFLWLLGDDDYLVNGAITKFFEIIEKHSDLSVILLSVQFLDIVTGKTNQMVKFDKDYLSRDGDDFFQKCEWGASALSSLVIRKADWNLQSLSNYFGSQWIHIAGIVHILSHHKPSYIVSNIMVIVRVSNDRWEGHFGNQLLVAFSYLGILKEMTELGCKEETYQFFAKDRFRRTLFEIIHLRPQSFNGRFLLAKRMMQYHKSYFAFWFLHLPILFMPTVLLAIIRSVRRGLFNTEQRPQIH
jgi:abequosyltransferase